MSTEYARPTKGKGWKAVPSTDDTDGWCVVHPTKKIATGGTRGRAVTFTKDRATRYAHALNVADAGVDLGEAKGMYEAASKYYLHSTQFGGDKREIEIDMGKALDFFEAIANAVEGVTSMDIIADSMASPDESSKRTATPKDPT